MSFTKDWFNNNIPRWERLVKPHLQTSKKTKVNVLIVGGCHEGRAPLWLFEHIKSLSHRESTMHIIDKFGPAILNRFKSNLKQYENNIHIVKVSDKSMLKHGLEEVVRTENFYDFIYLDGMHAQELLEMLVLVFPLLKPRGMLICDDNTNSKEHLPNCPKAAIDAFMYIYSPWIKAVDISWQAVMLKRTKAFKIKGCKSEFYHENMKTI